MQVTGVGLRRPLYSAPVGLFAIAVDGHKRASGRASWRTKSTSRHLACRFAPFQRDGTVDANWEKSRRR